MRIVTSGHGAKAWVALIYDFFFVVARRYAQMPKRVSQVRMLDSRNLKTLCPLWSLYEMSFFSEPRDPRVFRGDLV